MKIYDHKRHKNQQPKRARQKKERRKEIREWIIEKKKKLCCEKCGDVRWYILCFHHRNGEHKDIEISNMIRHGFSKENILKEMEKCDIYCMNCHTELHYFERLNEGARRCSIY